LSLHPIPFASPIRQPADSKAEIIYFFYFYLFTFIFCL
jgi:hypothetical protein